MKTKKSSEHFYIQSKAGVSYKSKEELKPLIDKAINDITCLYDRLKANKDILISGGYSIGCMTIPFRRARNETACNQRYKTTCSNLALALRYSIKFKRALTNSRPTPVVNFWYDVEELENSFNLSRNVVVVGIHCPICSTPVRKDDLINHQLKDICFLRSDIRELLTNSHKDKSSPNTDLHKLFMFGDYNNNEKQTTLPITGLDDYIQARDSIYSALVNCGIPYAIIPTRFTVIMPKWVDEAKKLYLNKSTELADISFEEFLAACNSNPSKSE